MLVLSLKAFASLAVVGSVAYAQSSNGTTVPIDSANYTLAITSNHTRGLRVNHRSLATCGNGNRGDGVCSNGQCCSQVSQQTQLFLLG
jgi:hypothetical protein